MNIQIKRIVVVVLIGVGYVHAQKRALDDESVQVSEEGTQEAPWYSRHGMKMLAAGALGINGYLLYKSHSGFREFVDTASSNAKQRFTKSVAVPAYMYYDRIKDFGFSKKDVATLAAVLVGCYGLSYHYRLVSSLRGWNFKETKEVVVQDMDCLKKHKVAVGISTLLAFLVAWILKNDARRSRIERFLWSLTHRQKSAISSCPNLTSLVEKAPDDPTGLHKHEEFRAMLDKHQENLLVDAVHEHRLTKDPLSLFDDEMMSS